MTPKAKNLISLGRQAAAKTFTRFNNLVSNHAKAGKLANHVSTDAQLRSWTRSDVHPTPSRSNARPTSSLPQLSLPNPKSTRLTLPLLPALIVAALALALLPASAALAEEGLPDGRVAEMVTPASNQDADVYVPYAIEEFVSQGVQTFFPFQVASGGGAVTYVADATTGGQAETGKGLGDQYLARRGAAGGWVQGVIQPAGQRRTQFQGFSSDLAAGVLVSGNGAEPLVAPLTGSAPGSGYPVLYARNDFGEASVEEALYRPLFTNAVEFNRSAEGFGVSQEVEDEKRRGQTPVFAGATSNFEELFFEANDDLTSPGDPFRPGLDARVKSELAAGENNNFLYRSVGGVSSLVSVLPDGEVAGNATFGGPPSAAPEHNPPDFSGAVSPDGDFVYWTDEPSERIYVRVNGEETVPVSPGAARYWTSAADGRLVFYVEGEQLFRYDAVSGTREALTGAGSGMQGVIGVSDDGSYVYFVADGALASGVTQQTCEIESEAEKNGLVPEVPIKGAICISPTTARRRSSPRSQESTAAKQSRWRAPSLVLVLMVNLVIGRRVWVIVRRPWHPMVGV